MGACFASRMLGADVKITKACTAFIVMLVAAASPIAAMACGSGRLFYEEKFSAMPDWVAADPNVSVGANGLIHTMTAMNVANWNVVSKVPCKNCEACVTVALQGPATDYPVAGLVFFFADNEHYAVAAISPNAGKFAVLLRSDGNWQRLIGWAEHAAINRGTTNNELSVSTRGNVALIAINGKTAAVVSPPLRFVNDDFGTNVGIYRERSVQTDKEPAVFAFKNLQVRDAQAVLVPR